MIVTRDADNEPNGWLLPLWHIDSGIKVDQVYLTVVAPGKTKGPHLHQVRCGRFRCIRGNVRIVTREGGEYKAHYSGEDHGFAEVYVPPGVPAAIHNEGTGDAYVLNMPTPPWRLDDRDEWPVEDWNEPTA